MTNSELVSQLQCSLSLLSEAKEFYEAAAESAQKAFDLLLSLPPAEELQGHRKKNSDALRKRTVILAVQALENLGNSGLSSAIESAYNAVWNSLIYVDDERWKNRSKDNSVIY